VKEVDQIFDLVRLENVAESGHSGAAVVDLMLDFFFVQAFADGAEIRPKISAVAIYAMAMLTTLFMKECGSSVLIFAGIGVNSRSGWWWEDTRKSDENRHATEGGTDSGRNFGVSLQGNRYLSCDGCR
jgi:hypothetical protein